MSTVPDTAPPMAELKLITMTINASIQVNLNLDVVARHTQLDDRIVGISYRDIIRGVCTTKSKGRQGHQGRQSHQSRKQVKEEDDESASLSTGSASIPDDTDADADADADGSAIGLTREDADYYTTNSVSGKFKNQCTFIINVGDKNINTKIFNNGKMVSVGCKSIDHAYIAADILRATFRNMEGLVIYTIPTEIVSNNIKKFFKDDLRKKFGDLVQLLAHELQLEDFNLEPFCSAIGADEAYALFQEELCPSYCADVMYIYTIITILKCYYPEDELLDNFQSPEFQYLLNMIINHTNQETNEISCDFPSYLNNKLEIPFDHNAVSIELINESTNCGYFLNRNSLHELMLSLPSVVKCEYDKNKYPGVITVYRTPTKDVKIIVFNTGKINITSTRTQEQVDQAYEFISGICRDHFEDLLLESEYHNKHKEYEDKLPTQFHVGMVDDQQYYLLKKSSITSNPRNVRILKLSGLSELYREKAH
jgi:TATA-box binding protein (TBP) (component of TFIID and TFIIIB)